MASAQVGAFYAATLMTSGVKLPIRRGLLLLAVLLVAGAAASTGVRRFVPHHGSGYAIPVLATAGLLVAFMVVINAGFQLFGLAVLVPAGMGSFLGALVAALWIKRPLAEPPAAGPL